LVKMSFKTSYNYTNVLKMKNAISKLTFTVVTMTCQPGIGGFAIHILDSFV